VDVCKTLLLITLGSQFSACANCTGSLDITQGYDIVFSERFRYQV